jgi:hypothetical protein
MPAKMTRAPLPAALAAYFALASRNRHNRGMGTRGRYTIVLFRNGGEGSDIESVVDSDDLIDVARALYAREIIKHSGAAGDAVRSRACARAKRLAGNDADLVRVEP